MNETSVTVVGNVASDVTKRRVGTEGQVVVNFRIMSTERRRDRVSGEWVDGDQFSAKVSCWRRLADHAHTSLMKGDPVVVRGRLAVHEYEVDGERRFSTEITADAVGPDLSRCTTVLTRIRTGVEAERSRELTGGRVAAGPAPAFAVPGVPAGVAPDALPAGDPLDPWAVAVEDPRAEQGPDPEDVLPVVA